MQKQSNDRQTEQKPSYRSTMTYASHIASLESSRLEAKQHIAFLRTMRRRREGRFGTCCKNAKTATTTGITTKQEGYTMSRAEK
eukprot:4578113-Alexandrium_andersonii.AAC.1